MIKYVIGLNTIDGSLKSIVDLVFKTFGTTTRKLDSGLGTGDGLPLIEVCDFTNIYTPSIPVMNMVYKYFFTTATDSDAFVLAVTYNALFPRPAGVGVTVQRVDSNY